jgi:hypothetical protein
MSRENKIRFERIDEEKEMFAVLKASVVNGQEVESTLLGIYEDKEDLKKDKKKFDVNGHKTVVRVKVKIEPIEYLGDIDNMK